MKNKIFFLTLVFYFLTKIAYSQMYECTLVRTVNDITVDKKVFYHALNSESKVNFQGLSYDLKLETLQQDSFLDFYLTIEKFGKDIIYYTEFSLEATKTESFNFAFKSNGFNGECNCELFKEEEE
ncbi:hypothetical protein [Aureivirga sp. CE67]|uniref:hypothetical protein n=1 Tax=Aureivirga sp. CE67 TaxID=1788983 RepID=UPI0018C91D6D|nr:hypothetical protein [Aureivirga sp. CE67]